MVSQQFGLDFVAQDRAGRIVLLAQAKTKLGTSERWATLFRRNLLSHGILPWSDYFLIATPDRMYLWVHETKPDAAPGIAIDSAMMLRPYFEKFHQKPDEIVPEAFKLLLFAWLNDIARSGGHGSSEWLSSLSNSLQRSQIEMT